MMSIGIWLAASICTDRRLAPAAEITVRLTMARDLPATSSIIGTTVDRTVFGSSVDSNWSFDGNDIHILRKSSGMQIIGTSADGKAVYAQPNVRLNSTVSPVFSDSAVVLSSVVDGIRVWLLGRHHIFVCWPGGNTMVPSNISSTGGSSACTANETAVLCLHRPSGDVLDIIGIHDSKSTRTVPIHVDGINHIHVDGDVIVNKFGVWFTLPSAEFKS